MCTTVRESTLSDFFVQKVALIRQTISSLRSHTPYPVVSSCPTEPFAAFEHVLPSEVHRLISGLNSCKSSAIDVVPIHVLKLCSPLFSRILAILFNMCLSQGTFPTAFKSAVVTPLLKKPSLDPSLPSSYHPISKLDTVSKLLGKVVLSRIRQHIVL